MLAKRVSSSDKLIDLVRPGVIKAPLDWHTSQLGSTYNKENGIAHLPTCHGHRHIHYYNAVYVW